MGSTCGTGPSSSTSTAPAPGLSTWPLDLLRVAVTLLLSTASYYLVERPIRLAKLRGAPGVARRPLAGVVTAVAIVIATFPAVADPLHRGRHDPPRLLGLGAAVPGAGGYAASNPSG